MTAQRLMIPLPLMMNADAYMEWDGTGNEPGTYTWYVRIKFGDSVIGRIAYSNRTQDKPSEDDVARIAADHLRAILFPGT